MQSSQFQHATRWNSVILKDFHFYFLLNQKQKVNLGEGVGQKVPILMDKTLRKYSHQHLWKKTVKFLTQLSAEYILSRHWSIKLFFFPWTAFIISSLSSFYTSFYPLEKVRQTQRNLDVVLRKTFRWKAKYQNLIKVTLNLLKKTWAKTLLKANNFKKDHWISHLMIVTFLHWILPLI